MILICFRLSVDDLASKIRLRIRLKLRRLGSKTDFADHQVGTREIIRNGYCVAGSVLFFEESSLSFVTIMGVGGSGLILLSGAGLIRNSVKVSLLFLSVILVLLKWEIQSKIIFIPRYIQQWTTVY